MTTIYKKFISPFIERLFGGGCRHYPTCSDYSREAIKRHGLLKGGLVGLLRVASCNPFSKKDYYDPVR